MISYTTSFLFFFCVCAHLYPTLCNSIDCSPPGSSVHGIFQARILECVAISSSRVFLFTHCLIYLQITPFFGFKDSQEWHSLKNRSFSLQSPLDCKEIQPVHPKGDQSWVFIERTDVEAETPIFWPRHGESWLISKDPDAAKDWGQEEKGTTEDEMVGWHHRLNGYGLG